MSFFKSIKRRRARAADLRRAESPTTDIETPKGSESADDALGRITQTVEVLKRLSDLRDQVESTDLELIDLETPVEEPELPERDIAPEPEAAEPKVVERRTKARRRSESHAPAATRPTTSSGWRPIGPMSDARPKAVVAPARPNAEPNVVGSEDPTERKPPTLETAPRREPAQSDLRAKIGQVFSPSAPVSRKDLFAGRTQQMEDLVNTVYERGQHAVIYGERGVGKTSLAVTMGLVLDQSGTPVVRINCDGADDFSTIWHKIFSEISFLPTVENQRSVRVRLEDMTTKSKVTPNDVRHSLQAVSTVGEVVIFIDEFDTVVDESVHGLFADTLKTLSDQLVSSTVVIIGVADNLDELIAQHGSVRRALAQIHMPRMSQAELAEIVGRGLRYLGMACESQALSRITQLSQGFPYYTKLLAQSATRSALEAGRPGIALADVDQAVDRVVARVHETIRGLYNQAISGGDGLTHQRVLRAAALAARDERGYFGAADVLDSQITSGTNGSELEDVVAQLERLTKPDRGPALEKKSTERGIRYRFSDPLLQPFVLMEGFASGEIEPSSLDQLSLAVGRAAAKERTN